MSDAATLLLSPRHVSKTLYVRTPSMHYSGSYGVLLLRSLAMGSRAKSCHAGYPRVRADRRKRASLACGVLGASLLGGGSTRALDVLIHGLEHRDRHRFRKPARASRGAVPTGSGRLQTFAQAQ